MPYHYGIFHLNEDEAEARLEESGDHFGAGWYWHPCFPGCMPNGESVGPFATESDALADARAQAESDAHSF